MKLNKQVRMNVLSLSLLFFINTAVVSPLPCDVIGGRSEIILDVTESLGKAYDQQIVPDVLPIEGSQGNEVEVKLSNEGTKHFSLQGNKLSLKTHLDRDFEQTSSIRFEISCIDKATTRVRSIPVVIRIQDINDNAPLFKIVPYHITIREDTPVNTAIFSGIKATDFDAGRNGQVEYRILDFSPKGYPPKNPFDIRFPYQGTLFLNSPLDYELNKFYNITIIASDNPTNASSRLNSTTTLTVRVKDVDDQNPFFDTAASPPSCSSPENYRKTCTKEYYSSITEGTIAGLLNVYPGKIYARDPDSLAAKISYSFISGSPRNYQDYFSIDSRSGIVRQIKEVNRNLFKKFDITIQATETSSRKGRTNVRLLINVEKVDSFPPKLVISGQRGKVFEGSNPGTLVTLDDESDTPISISVFDSDIEPGEKPPMYAFELTSNAFKVNRNGHLEVSTSHLDRDPPNQPVHTFQIIARENREGGQASAPVTISVRLIDINDNAPRMPILPSVIIPAGSKPRKVTEIRATDIDEGENAMIRYKITGGSSGMFSLDENTGVLSSTGPLKTGQKFFIKIAATDKGNLSSQGFVEVKVSRGPNTNGPIFPKDTYSVTIPENIPYGDQLLRLQAADPENDTSYYTITEGNSDGLFEIETLTGQITVVAPLDREVKSHYLLRVTASDSEGKSNSVSVSIIVLDVNDVAPMFVGEPYTFRVDEGHKDTFVGTVQANDEDLEDAGIVEYLIEDTSSVFRINKTGGQIFTSLQLDYEHQKVHYLEVVARDKSAEALSSTTTVTILVNDLSDEKPIFTKGIFAVSVKEDLKRDSEILIVKAVDKDTKPVVTYKMLEGDQDLFKLGPKTGQISLSGKLDFEAKRNHTLLIGTQENKDVSNGATAEVHIFVEDVNDESPTIAPLHTVTLGKRAPLNTLVAKVSAKDADGTTPNNLVKLSLLDDRLSMFKINEMNGEIRLWRSLSQVNDTQLDIKVKAIDQGSPPRSSVESFRVLLLEETFAPGVVQPNTVSSEVHNGGGQVILASSPRFSKEYFLIKVEEGAPSGRTVAKVPLMSTSLVQVTCTILSGNEGGVFKTRVTAEGNCDVVSSKSLDYETATSYKLTLALHPSEFKVKELHDTSILSKAVIEFQLRDTNDNSPKFLVNHENIVAGLKNTVLTYALHDSSIETTVIEVQAKDLDSGNMGLVSYKLLPESNRGNYFSVKPTKGRIYTKRQLRNIPLELLPFNVTLVAYDNPGTNEEHRQMTFLNIIIPVIENSDRYILIVNASKKDVKAKLNRFKKIISELTGDIVQVEHIYYARGKTKGESQIWFHLIDKKFLNPKPFRLSLRKSQNVLRQISRALGGLPTLEIISPDHLKQRMEEEKTRNETHFDLRSIEGSVKSNLMFSSTLEYVLMGIAGIIILFVVSAVVAICILWARFSRKWNSADKTVMLIPPVVTQPSSVIDSVSKEYEVQVLHMSVPMDDDSVQGTHRVLKSSSQAYLDNVSYISKSRHNLEGSSLGASSGVTPPNCHIAIGNGDNKWYSGESSNVRISRGVLSGTHLAEDSEVIDVEPCGENVFFSRSGHVLNSMETTTEL